MTHGTFYSYRVMITDLQQRLKKEGHIDILVRVRPHAARSELTGILEDGSLKIAIAAPAEDGRGNTMLMKFLGQQFGVSASLVEILSGKTARLKLVRITSA